MEIYEIDKILYSKKNFTTLDKIDRLVKLRDALENKLDMIKKGKKFPTIFKNQQSSMTQYQKAIKKEIKEEAPAISEVDEAEGD